MSYLLSGSWFGGMVLLGRYIYILEHCKMLVLNNTFCMVRDGFINWLYVYVSR